MALEINRNVAVVVVGTPVHLSSTLIIIDYDDEQTYALVDLTFAMNAFVFVFGGGVAGGSRRHEFRSGR